MNAAGTTLLMYSGENTPTQAGSQKAPEACARSVFEVRAPTVPVRAFLPGHVVDEQEPAKVATLRGVLRVAYVKVARPDIG